MLGIAGIAIASACGTVVVEATGAGAGGGGGSPVADASAANASAADASSESPSDALVCPGPPMPSPPHGWTFDRPQDFLDYFRILAVMAAFTDPARGVACSQSIGPQGCTYDPRLVQMDASDIHYSDPEHRFVAPDGNDYVWVYLPSFNQYLAADMLSGSQYDVLLAYTTACAEGCACPGFGP